MMTDEFLNIDTPENVVFGYEVVGIGSRFMAALVDSVLILIIQAIVHLTFFTLARLFTTGASGNTAVIAALLGLLGFFLFWGYYIFFEMRWNGSSPGKQLVGLRVIRQDGTPITLSESIIRNLVRLVDFFPFAYGLGIVAMFIDGQSRRLGDMAAGTLVVRDQENVTLASLRQPAQPANVLPVDSGAEAIDVSQWPIHLLTETDIQLAEDFLRRQHELANRQTLGPKIARRLMQRMGLPAHQAVFASDAARILTTIVQARRSQ